MHEQDRIHRRRFAGHVVAATGGLAVGLAAAAGRSAEIPPAPKLPEDPVPPAKPPGEPPLELLLLTYLVRNYPSDRFDDAAMQGIYREIRGDVARGQVLATFPLRNSDEPAFVFSAFRGDAPTDAPPARPS